MSDEQVADVPAEAGEAPSGQDDFRSMIPEEYRDHPSLATYKDVGSMAKSLINAQQMVGAEKVPVPGSWATDEDWNSVYSKLGRPDEATGYNLENAEPGEMLDWFQNTAHAAGLNPRQAQQIFDEYNEYVGTATAASDEQIESYRTGIETELRQEFGNQFENKMNAANDLLQEFDAPDLTEIQLADGTLLGDNPELVRFMVRISDFVSEQISEDGFAGRDSRPNLSEQDIQNRVSELTKKDSPYWAKMHPDHQRFVDEVLQLREQLYG